jgi:hypothetical protein
MSLPPTPVGYSNWNEYIEIQGAIVAAAQGLTFQEGKASVKLLDVAGPVRQAFGTPSYREYNVFTTWAERTVAPTEGRPWRDGFDPAPAYLTTQAGEDLLTQAGENIITQ